MRGTHPDNSTHSQMQYHYPMSQMQPLEQYDQNLSKSGHIKK